MVRCPLGVVVGPAFVILHECFVFHTNRCYMCVFYVRLLDAMRMVFSIGLADMPPLVAIYVFFVCVFLMLRSWVPLIGPCIQATISCFMCVFSCFLCI